MRELRPRTKAAEAAPLRTIPELRPRTMAAEAAPFRTTLDWEVDARKSVPLREVHPEGDTGEAVPRTTGGPARTVPPGSRSRPARSWASWACSAT